MIRGILAGILALVAVLFTASVFAPNVLRVLAGFIAEIEGYDFGMDDE